jgi:hypothetical protein
MSDNINDVNKVDEKLMKRLQTAVVKKLIEKIESDTGTSQDLNTAVRLIQNYNIDLDTDKEEDEMSEEEKALLDEWADAGPDEMDLPPTEYEVE